MPRGQGGLQCAGTSKNDKSIKQFGIDSGQQTLMFKPFVSPNKEMLNAPVACPASAPAVSPNTVATATDKRPKQPSSVSKQPSSVPQSFQFVPLGRPTPRKVKRPVTLGTPVTRNVDPVELEVRTFVNDLIRTIIYDSEQSEAAIEDECRRSLDAMISQVEVNPPKPKGTCEQLKKKRQHYKNKQEILEMIDAEVKAGSSAHQAVKRLRTVSGYEHISMGTIAGWRKAGPTKRRGRKPATAFEDAVIGELIYTEIEKVENVQQAQVIANITHSYAIIKRAAQKTQKTAPFLKDPYVQKLTFSLGWIQNFLRRTALRKRRITAKEKNLPPVAEVRERMAEIQSTISHYELCERVSADETGIFFGAPPKYQYIPTSAQRATAPESDDKGRWTSLLWGTSYKMGPSFNIIKMSVKGVDLSSSRVLHNLHTMAGFTAADGWELKEWRRKLTLPMKGQKEPITSTHVRPYLFHKPTMTVITVQIKAWMDSAGICMWADVQLGPYFKKYHEGRCCIVWDNCGSHNVAAVAEVFEEWGIAAENLPPNMTDLLQVMDLVVNGPVKSGIRAARIDALFDYFQSWKIQRLQHAAKKDETLPPPFAPPKPKLVDGLRTLLKVLNTSLNTEQFNDSLHKCFVEVGLAEQLDETFVKFSYKKKGHLTKLIPSAQLAREDAISVGDIVTELALTNRPADVEEDSDAQSDDDDDNDDVDDEEEAK